MKSWWNVQSSQQNCHFQFSKCQFLKCVSSDTDENVIWVWFFRTSPLGLWFGVSIWSVTSFLSWWSRIIVLSHVIQWNIVVKFMILRHCMNLLICLQSKIFKYPAIIKAELPLFKKLFCLIQWRPFKSDEKWFLFHLKKLFSVSI